MKKLVLLLLALSLWPLTTSAQSLNDIDFIAPFHEELAAVKKGDQWSFINADGKLLFDFRNDLVVTNMGEKSYPVFKGNRCLIKATKNGIDYFGYIDNKGETVIAPQFLNASNFNKNRALVLKLDKEQQGESVNVLGQAVVKHSYVHVVIDEQGNYLKYLGDWKKITLSSKILKKPPMIRAKLLSNGLYAISENNKWSIVKIED